MTPNHAKMISFFSRAVSVFCCSMAAACLFQGSAKARDSVSYIEFKHQARSYRVERRQINPTTFRFNPGAPKKIKMVTLDWPPYIGKDICRQGWVQQFTVALLTSQGYEVTTQFVPWGRAIVTAETGNVDVLYPEYFIEETAPSDVIEGTFRRDHLALSEPFTGGTIAFLKRKGETVFFSGNLLDLEDEKIGVVRGYQNTPEFDALMDKGFFKISRANNDFLNVKKLLGRRVNLIVGDPSVIFHTLTRSGHSDDQKKALVSAIEVVDPPLGYNSLYFAVSRKRPGWERTLKDLNTGIREFYRAGTLTTIIKTVKKDCGFQPFEAN